jgi:hypothetical protein
VVGKLIAIDGSAFIELEGMIYRQEHRGSIGGYGFPSIALGGILLSRGKWCGTFSLFLKGASLFLRKVF